MQTQLVRLVGALLPSTLGVLQKGQRTRETETLTRICSHSVDAFCTALMTTVGKYTVVYTMTKAYYLIMNDQGLDSAIICGVVEKVVMTGMLMVVCMWLSL